MYMGLVQEVGTITYIHKREGVIGLKIKASTRFIEDLQVGGSISVNGVCLTATKVSTAEVCVDVTDATKSMTNLCFLTSNSRVNLERSARAGTEIGGHMTAGHVDGTARVTAVRLLGEAMVLSLAVPTEVICYVFVKGFLAINGASLTVASLDIGTNIAIFNIAPETLRQTNFRGVQAGDELNIEVDPISRVLVNTLQRIMSAPVFD